MVFLGIQLALSLIAAIAAIFALLWAHRAAREGKAMRSLLERFEHHESALVPASRIHEMPRDSTDIDSQENETPIVLSLSELDALEAMAASTGRTLDEMIGLALERALDELEAQPERQRELEALYQRHQDNDDDDDDSEIRARDTTEKE